MPVAIFVFETIEYLLDLGIWLDAQGRSEMLDGFRHAAGYSGQCDSQIDVGLRGIGIDSYSGFKMRDRLLHLPGTRQHNAEIIMRIDIIRLEPQGFFESMELPPSRCRSGLDRRPCCIAFRRHGIATPTGYSEPPHNPA